MKTGPKPQARDLVARLVRPEVRALEAYRVAPSAGLVKLDAMENPHAWPDALVAEWLEVLRGVPVNRYPDARATGLRTRLREWMELPDSAGLVLGNGSDELILLLTLAVAGPAAVVLAPEPTFVMYRQLALVAGCSFVGVPLERDGFGLDLDALLGAMREHRPALVFLAYPNNPTGNLFDETAIGRILDAAPGAVVIDEAYAPFAQSSFLDRLGAPNLLVMRTLSKLGLAGLRVGCLAGPPEWTAELEKLRLPYNLGTLAQASADFALRHREVLEAQCAGIRAERARLEASLRARNGLRVWPSRANFILFRAPAGRGTTVHEGLRERGVLIKNLHGSHPFLDDALRVTVGRGDENARFLEALAATLA